jgi:methionyl-tRNA formyltransferase
MSRAVVFAYHDVGARCLRTLLARSVDVALVVTHRDNPAEGAWFESVAAVADEHDLPAITPEDPNCDEVVARVKAARPEFVFSFYYRLILGPSLLGAPTRGALNVHGSLLPKYRGRAPVNWAVIRGERETGATLHYMVDKPDAGDLVDQQAVPILPDDRAIDVMRKVTVAAELVLHRSLPGLIAGTAPRRPQDLAAGFYLGGRKPADGAIDWSAGAQAVHNLVRGVAPPYPGAFATIAGRPARILRTVLTDRRGTFGAPTLFVEQGRCFVQCADRRILRILELEIDDRSSREVAFEGLLPQDPVALS